MKFYKYKALCKDGSNPLWQLEDFLKQNVYLPSLNALNDPYEGRFKFKNFTPEQVFADPEVLKHTLDHFRTAGEPELTEEELRTKITSKEFQDCLADSELSFVEDFFENNGVLCLTVDKNNIPMWAHYGDNHTGYCVVFELDLNHIQKLLDLTDKDFQEYINLVEKGEEILSFNYNRHSSIFSKISYTINVPVISLPDFSKIPDNYSRRKYLAEHSFAIKFDQWSYESEFRLIATGTGSLNLKLYAPFLSVTGVIVGSKMDNRYVKSVYDLCKIYGIKLYKALCSEYAYEILIEERAEISNVEPVIA
jgi:hypothetical protein